jgi:hypothetical protein
MKRRMENPASRAMVPSDQHEQDAGEIEHQDQLDQVPQRPTEGADGKGHGAERRSAPRAR